MPQVEKGGLGVMRATGSCPIICFLVDAVARLQVTQLRWMALERRLAPNTWTRAPVADWGRNGLEKHV